MTPPESGKPTSAASKRLPREDLLQFHDPAGRMSPVRTVAEWQGRRAEIAQGMEAVMGPFPGAGTAERCALDIRVEEEIDRGCYVLRRLTYQSEPGGRTPAFLCVPKAALGTTARSFPGVLCLHPTNFELGAGVVVDLGGKANRQYASELAARGYVTVAPTYPHLAGYAPGLSALGYASGTMKAIWDNVRALDLLETLPFVQPGTFGTIGHSLGGHNAVFTAVFESRLAAVVSSCGLDSFSDYMAGNPDLWIDGQGWCQERYMPRLAHFRKRLDEIPFDFHEVIGALAPRHVFISAPYHDSNFQWQSVDRIVASARPVFALHGAADRLRIVHPDCDHDFPSAQREAAYRLFDDVLGNASRGVHPR